MSNLPFTNSLIQYYTQLKDNNLPDELEIISVDINDSMNVAYSKYYLDFPWIITDISNLLLRQQLVESYFKHKGLVVPCLIILNSAGEVFDHQGKAVIDAIINHESSSAAANTSDDNGTSTVQSLTLYYQLHPPGPLRRLHDTNGDRNGEAKEGDDYDLYASYQVDETIPTLSKEEKENSVPTLKAAKRRSISPQRLDRRNSLSQDYDEKHKSLLEKISSFSFYEKDEEKINDDKSVREPLKSAVKLSTSVDHDQKVRFITVETESVIPFSKVKQQLLLLPTLTIMPRRSNKELELLRSLFQARTEVEQIEIIIIELQEQRQFNRQLSVFSSGNPVTFYKVDSSPSFVKQQDNQQMLFRERITMLKEKSMFYERILSTLTFNESFPLFNIGFPNQKWEKEFCKSLSIVNSNWENELISYRLLSSPADEKGQVESAKKAEEKKNLMELHASYEELVSYYNMEYEKYSLELLRYCQITRTHRLATARVCEFISILVSVTLFICIPVVIGVVIAVYKR
jgi:hypothetical protein